MKLKPLNDRLLVKRLPEERKSILWIPDIAAKNSQTAEVVAVGPKVYGLKPGDKVMLPGIAAQIPDWEERDYIMVQVGDVGGIFG